MARFKGIAEMRKMDTEALKSLRQGYMVDLNYGTPGALAAIKKIEKLLVERKASLVLPTNQAWG